MSSRSERLRLRRRPTDGGFTLIEVMVSLLIVGAMAASLLPLLMTTSQAARKARLETEAKNQAQRRVEQMRNLQFHVDRQNGPYIDLLDIYYTSTSTTTTTRADGSQGTWLSAAPGTGGAPSGPAYRVTVPSMPDDPRFSQQIYTQFLRTTHTIAAVPSSYDSQVVGSDSPPSLLVGVTVFTTYRYGGETSTYRTYTEIADGRGTGALITTQARSVALRAYSTSPDGVTLEGQVAGVSLDGSLSTGSAASVQGEGAHFDQTGLDRLLGAIASAAAPPNPAGSAGVADAENPVQTLGGGPCGWGSAGKTQAENISATTSAGQPTAPSDAGEDVSIAGAPLARAGLLRTGLGCGGYAYAFRNTIDPMTYDPAWGLLEGLPLVGIADANGGGYAATASGGVSATPIVASPTNSSSAKASATIANRVRILPTTFATGGLVTVRLTYANIVCVSGQAPVADYELVVEHPGGASTVTFSSATGISGSLPDPSSIVLSNGYTLGQYLSWQVATEVTDGDNGVHALGPVMRLSLADEVVGPGGAEVEIGKLSCAAEDRR